MPPAATGGAVQFGGTEQDHVSTGVYQASRQAPTADKRVDLSSQSFTGPEQEPGPAPPPAMSTPLPLTDEPTAVTGDQQPEEAATALPTGGFAMPFADEDTDTSSDEAEQGTAAPGPAEFDWGGTPAAAAAPPATEKMPEADPFGEPTPGPFKAPTQEPVQSFAAIGQDDLSAAGFEEDDGQPGPQAEAERPPVEPAAAPPPATPEAPPPVAGGSVDDLVASVLGANQAAPAVPPAPAGPAEPVTIGQGDPFTHTPPDLHSGSRQRAGSYVVAPNAADKAESAEVFREAPPTQTSDLFNDPEAFDSAEPSAPAAAESAAVYKAESADEAGQPGAIVRAGDNQLHLRLQGTGAIAESGQVRALDIEVPVPGTWVGHRRVTLQLRLTLTPTPEDEDGGPGGPS
jgi:hypothetical protein